MEHLFLFTNLFLHRVVRFIYKPVLGQQSLCFVCKFCQPIFTMASKTYTENLIPNN
jgi:hypothetical protein